MQGSAQFLFAGAMLPKAIGLPSIWPITSATARREPFTQALKIPIAAVKRGPVVLGTISGGIIPRVIFPQ